MRLLPLLLAGCAPGYLIFDDKGDATTPGGTETDTDTDADSDADTDTDPGVDTATGPTGVETGDTGPAPDPNPPTWRVDCNGGADFTTIQAAIEAAVSGDRIGLEACTYFERIDYIGKALEIYGIDGPAVTIIDGRGDGTVVDVEVGEALGTRLAGVTITGGLDTDDGAAVELFSGVLELEDVVISGNGPAENLIHAFEGLLDLTNVTIDGNFDVTGSAVYSKSGGLTITRSAIDCDQGLQAIYHHNQLILTDSTVSCGGGYGIYDYHGEDMIRRATITGGIAGIYAHDTESTEELPDNPTELIQVYNSAVSGGEIGIDIKWMTAVIENSVIWAPDAGVSLVAMGGAEIRSTGFLDADCGISTDFQWTFPNNGFWDVTTRVCGGTAGQAITGDPRLVSFPTDLHLGAGSAWIDTGDPAEDDVDGTRADIGIYGGPIPPL
jgi:hypothetical protein